MVAEVIATTITTATVTTATTSMLMVKAMVGVAALAALRQRCRAAAMVLVSARGAVPRL